MAASKQDIAKWFEAGRADGATHMLVVCDLFDHDDFPVYIAADEDVRAKEEECNSKPMTDVMEVYSLTMDMEEQLEQASAFNY